MALVQEWSAHNGNTSTRLRLHTAFVREWSTHVEEAVEWLHAVTAQKEGCHTSKISAQDAASDADNIDRDARLPLVAMWPTEFEIEELEDELVKFQVDLERLKMSCRITQGNASQGQIRRENGMVRCKSEQVIRAESSVLASMPPQMHNTIVTPTSAVLKPSGDVGSGTTDSTTMRVAILTASDCSSSSLDFSTTQVRDAGLGITTNLPPENVNSIKEANSIIQDSTNAPHALLGVSTSSNVPFRSIEDLAEQLLAFKVDIERLRMSFTLAPEVTPCSSRQINQEAENPEHSKRLDLVTSCPQDDHSVGTPTFLANKENCNDEVLKTDTPTMLGSTICTEGLSMCTEGADDNCRCSGFSSPMVISARGITTSRGFIDDSIRDNSGEIQVVVGTPSTSTRVPTSRDSQMGTPIKNSAIGTPINNSAMSTPINTNMSLAATSSTIMQQLQNKSHAEFGGSATPTRTTKKSTLHGPAQVAKVAKTPSVSSPVVGKRSPRQLDKRSTLQPALHCRHVGPNAQQYLAQEMVSLRQRGRKPAIQQGLQRHQGDLGARSM